MQYEEGKQTHIFTYLDLIYSVGPQSIFNITHEAADEILSSRWNLQGTIERRTQECEVQSPKSTPCSVCVQSMLGTAMNESIVVYVKSKETRHERGRETKA